jgi:hypothetical protein
MTFDKNNVPNEVVHKEIKQVQTTSSMGNGPPRKLTKALPGRLFLDNLLKDFINHLTVSGIADRCWWAFDKHLVTLTEIRYANASENYCAYHSWMNSDAEGYVDHALAGIAKYKNISSYELSMTPC